MLIASVSAGASHPGLPGAYCDHVGTVLGSLLQVSSADINIRYFVDYVTRRVGPRSRVLDYGCGRADLVRALRSVGVEAYGADVFFEGMDFTKMRVDPLIESGVVRLIPPSGDVPFPDGWFDLIVSDQVLEHVDDLGKVANELQRLLCPGGVMLHHFPTIEVWREPHFNVWFSHRLPSPIRRPYLRWSHSLGLGKAETAFPDAKSWAMHVDAWLSRFCRFRRERDVLAAFRGPARRADTEYCVFRAAATNHPVVRRIMQTRLGAQAGAWLFRRLAFSAVEICARD